MEHNDELVQAINEKLAADGTGLQLEIMYVPSDVFSDKVNMMLQGGDEFDLLAVMEDQKSFTTYIGSEGIIPITQYVKDSEVLNRVIPQYMWESATVGGEIYTIPANWTEMRIRPAALPSAGKSWRSISWKIPRPWRIF